MNIPLEAYLTVSSILFGIGVYGVLSQKGAVMVLMSTEIILNAALLNVIAFWRWNAPADIGGQIFAIIIMTIASVEMSVGLAIMLLIFRNKGSQQVTDQTLLRG